MAITTAEQLLAAKDLGRCELVAGELRTLIPPGARHGRVAFTIALRVGSFVEQRSLGASFAAETGFLLARDPDTVRAPDFAFVRDGRAPVPDHGYYPGAPDLAVEVLSPDDRPGAARDKVAAWLDAGARSVWVVEPLKRAVTVHRALQAPEALGEDDILRDPVLPGFAIGVRELFV